MSFPLDLQQLFQHDSVVAVLAGGFRLGREYRIRREAPLTWIEKCELDNERPERGAQHPPQAPSR